MTKKINFVLDKYLSISGGKIDGNLTVSGDIDGVANKAISDSLGNVINTTYATKTELEQEVANLVNSAPETLDTLKELSDALGNDPNFATTVATQIGTKADDSKVVHNSGNESISGTKTFSNSITMKNSTLTIGTKPSSAQYTAIHFSDKTGAVGTKNRLATIEYSISTTGDASLLIGPYQYIANRTSYNGALLNLKITSAGVKTGGFDGTFTASQLVSNNHLKFGNGTEIWVE